MSSLANDPADKVAGSVTVVGMHYQPETTGNAPYTTALCTALVRAGYRVRMVTGVPHYPEWRVRPPYRWGLRWAEQVDGVDVVRLRHFVPRHPGMAGRLWMELTFLAQVAPRTLRDKSDVVVAISPTLSGLAAAVVGRRGRPLGLLVQDLNGSGAREAGVVGGRMSRVIERVEMSLISRATKIGVIAPRFAQIIGQSASVDPSRFVDLPNFSHVDAVTGTSAEDSRKILGWPTGRYTIVHTGNMGMKQGLDVVVDAARLSQNRQDWLYVLVGDGNQRAELQEMARGVENLLFVDPLDAESYPHALNAADVLLLTERCGVREMSLPSKLTSYAVAARPIVASIATDGMSGDLLAACDGAALVKPGNAEELVLTLADVRSDEFLRERLLRGALALRHRVGGRTEADKRYVRFVDELSVPPEQKESADASREKVVLVVEPHGGGHRFRYARLLTDYIRAQGWQPILGTSVSAQSRPEYATHFAESNEPVVVTECSSNLPSIEAASRRIGAVHTVIPDGDSYLGPLAARGWRGAASLSILVMRFPRGRELQHPTKLLKRIAICIVGFRRHVALRRLVSGVDGDLKPGDIADPVTLSLAAGPVRQVRDRLGRELFWFLVIGSITRRKNVVSIIRALSQLGSPSVGLVLAGRIDADVRTDIDQVLEQLPEVATRVEIVDAMLSEEDFDAFLEVADCVIVAHSNNGPSGVLAKAAAAGTRVLAAGAPSLRRDCAMLGTGALWTELDPDAIADGMVAIMCSPVPTSVQVATADDFARSLLPSEVKGSALK